MRARSCSSPSGRTDVRAERSVVLDLKGDAGRGVLLAMVEEADALVENFRPGFMMRLGLTADVLRECKPRLVSCGISGFGIDGPFSQARWPASAPVPGRTSS